MKTHFAVNEDPLFVLESSHGFKVVYCPHGKPAGGRDNGNYVILADGLNWQEAVNMVRRLRK